MTRHVVVACVDVGREAGWAVVEADNVAQHGERLSTLTDMLAQILKSGKALALGFECPLYFPVRQNVDAELRGRLGEGSPPWCAGPGSQSLIAGLGQMNAVLSDLHSRCPGTRATTRWEEFVDGTARVLIWEAYVTTRQGEIVPLPPHVTSATSQHAKDSLAAALAFSKRMRGEICSDLKEERAISLAGLQILAIGLSSDVSLLSHGCLVVKARKPQ